MYKILHWCNCSGIVMLIHCIFCYCDSPMRNLTSAMHQAFEGEFDRLTCATNAASHSRLIALSSCTWMTCKKRIVEQPCADCANEARHCQKAGLQKARMLNESASNNCRFCYSWPFSGLPLFQEQDIMNFYYACHYHSVHLLLLSPV